jgi:hypothetical protein
MTPVTVLPDVFGSSDGVDWLVERLGEAGWEARVEPARWDPIPVGSEPGEIEEALDSIGTAWALAELDLAGLVVGLGLGGSLALQAGSMCPGVTAVVAIGGRLVVPTLTDCNPIQPLDLLPGLAVPVQLHFGDEDPLVLPHHVTQLRERLAPRRLTWQVLTYPGARTAFLEPARPGYSGRTARTAWARIRAFLRHLDRETP